jgi:hypothetical protein
MLVLIYDLRLYDGGNVVIYLFRVKLCSTAFTVNYLPLDQLDKVSEYELVLTYPLHNQMVTFLVGISAWQILPVT